MQKYLKMVGNGQRTARDLIPTEAEEAMRMILSGGASIAQTAAFMAALRIKEESTDELATFGRVLREYSTRIETNHPALVDICVPYDGRSKTFSVIPAAALIAAACDVKLSLHGRLGQNTPPKFGFGVGDVLKQLGIQVDLSLEAARTLIDDNMVGMAFVTSSQFAPLLETFNQVRLEYGMRSFFNTIEKLINPFGAHIGIVGVFHGPVLRRVALAMQAQGYERGIAVQGPEGSSDVFTSRRTPIAEFGKDGSPELIEWSVDPSEFGWWERAEEYPAPVTLEANAELTRKVLDPAAKHDVPESYRRSCVLTAGLIVYAAGKTDTFQDGLAVAQTAIDSGAAYQRLVRLREASQEAALTDNAPSSINL
jgi:anthranilate phosphoribosyltransferase